MGSRDGAAAAKQEMRWQYEHMSSAVKSIMRRLPDPPMPATELGALIQQMHAWITGVCLDSQAALLVVLEVRTRSFESASTSVRVGGGGGN
jgi:hypothetical protein